MVQHSFDQSNHGDILHFVDAHQYLDMFIIILNVSCRYVNIGIQLIIILESITEQTYVH